MIIGDKHLKMENLKSNEGKSGYSKEGRAASPQWFPQEAALCIYSGTGDREGGCGRGRGGGRIGRGSISGNIGLEKGGKG